MAIVSYAEPKLKSDVQGATDIRHPHPESHRRFRWGDMFLYIALTVLAALFCLPFVWLVLTSLKPSNEVFGSGFLPSTWTWNNYTDVFHQAPVLKWMLNSTIVAVLGVISVAFSSSLVAYGFARLRFRGRNALFALVIGTYLLPGSVIMIPTFLIWNKLGLVNTLWPLWAGNLFGSAFYIFMLRQFLLTIPQDLVDSARLDGAGFLRIYWNIMLPLIRPAMVAVAIFEFNAKWNDFMGPLIYLNNPDRYTMALGLASFKSDFAALGTQWSLLLAASVIFTIPMVIIFFLFQRYFMEGITHSGMKG